MHGTRTGCHISIVSDILHITCFIRARLSNPRTLEIFKVV